MLIVDFRTYYFKLIIYVIFPIFNLQHVKVGAKMKQLKQNTLIFYLI